MSYPRKHNHRWPMYYLAIQMPNTGLSAKHVRYYKASKDLRHLLFLEQRLNPISWKQTFLESLLIIPKKHYKFPKRMPDEVTMFFLGKVIGIIRRPPKYTISTTRAQFILPEIWTQEHIAPNYLKFVLHDYNTASQKR
ncbi:DUF7679 family protein [Leuconostoc citreum]